MADKVWVGTSTLGDWSVAANWSPSGVPGAADNVRIPPGSAVITAGLNQSAVALGYVIFEPGYSATVASAAANLQLTCSRFEFHGTGLAYIDLSASAISASIFNSASAATGLRGLYLKGSALVTVNVLGGKVGLASRPFETATIATVRCVDPKADVWVGSGVSLTTYYQDGGNGELRAAATTVTCYGGVLKTREIGAITTLNANGGEIYPESTGTITTCNCNGGTTDFTGSGAARTVTTLKQNRGSTLIYDPAVLTITTRAAPDDPIRLTAAAA